MSTLNKAFIKAYQRRGVGAPHIPMPPPQPSERAASSRSPVSASPVGRRIGDDDLGATGTPAKPPAPHLALGSALAGQVLEDGLPRPPSTRPDGADLPMTSAETLSEASALGVLQPLTQPSSKGSGSEVLPPSPQPSPGGRGSKGHEARPAYEVERFEWPAVVTSLLDQSQLELAALVEELLPEGGGTILMSGCRRGEGRTSIALLLARHLANTGARVALVDADFRRPQIAASLGTVAEVGWEETLSDTSWAEASIESLTEGLVVVPLRRPLEEAVVTANSAALRATLQRVQAEFDVICVDAGPLAESAAVCHAIWFGDAQVEAVVVVRDVRHSRLEQTHAVGRQAVQLGAGRWAIIENFV